MEKQYVHEQILRVEVLIERSAKEFLPPVLRTDETDGRLRRDPPHRVLGWGKYLILVKLTSLDKGTQPFVVCDG